MKHQKSIKILAVILAVAAGLVIAVSAAYDSSEDPLVSLSYLRNIFKQEMLDSLKNEIDAIVDERVQAITDGTESEPDDAEDPYEYEEPAETASTGFEVLELHAGQQLYALDACEIMLRSGSAVCIAPDPTQGIADYTTAVEIYNAESLTKNHMCLIPRGDGRGLLVLSEVSYIMVRGEYNVVGE